MPLAEAKALLARAATATPRILVGLSGGKDSLGTLDLAVQQFGAANVVAFSMELVRELRCFRAPIEAAARRYGVKVEYVPHFDLGRMYKYAVLRPHTAGAAQLRETKMTDIEQLVRKRTGVDWIAYGHRAAESPQRRGMLNVCQGYNEQARRVYPIWRWNQEQIFAYLRSRRIPLPPSMGRNRLSGIDLRPRTLRWIKEHYPDDFERICVVFPFAPVQLKRDELYPDRLE